MKSRTFVIFMICTFLAAIGMLVGSIELAQLLFLGRKYGI